MKAFWEKTGDPLGDFMRLTFLLEEALERLGAPEEGTLGEKMEAVEVYLQVQDAELVAALWAWIRLRNQVVHRRVPVPPESLEQGTRLVARLLRLLELQGHYAWEELDERFGALKTFPPPPALTLTAVEPERAKAPELDPGSRPTEVPRRSFAIRRSLQGMRLRLPPMRR